MLIFEKIQEKKHTYMPFLQPVWPTK